MNRNDPPGFLGRWSRRKQDARLGRPVEEQPTPPVGPETPDPLGSVASAGSVTSGPSPANPVDPTAAARGAEQGNTAQPIAADRAGRGGDAVPVRSAEPVAEAPALTMDDVRGLTFESDYTRFTDRAVPADVRNAAMKKLFFSDPHFNTMDGLDVYIEDYNVYQPLTESMLRKMVSARAVGLFADEPPLETAAFPTQPADPDDPAHPTDPSHQTKPAEPASAATLDQPVPADDPMRAPDHSRDGADASVDDAAQPPTAAGDPPGG